MCSVADDGNIEDLDITLRGSKAKSKLVGKTCMKCSKNLAVVLVRLNDPLCKECFMTYCTHKFRSTIGKARQVGHDEKVLLAVSGSPSSMAMLHLVSEGISDKAAKKLRFHPAVLFINEGTALGQTREEQKHNIEAVKKVVEGKGLDLHVFSLEYLFHAHSTNNGPKKPSDEETYLANESKTLQCLFETVSSLTAKEDLLKSLRQELIVLVARNQGYSKIMVGDCANRIAVRLLSDISQGRGEALPFGTSFADDRHGDVKVLRPMREFVAKEISLYNHFSGIEAISIPSLSTKQSSHASIDRLTEEFISGLQAQFPFTVNTVFRTGDKLTVKKQSDEFLKCALCGVPVVPSQTSFCKTFEEMDCSDNQEAVCIEDKSAQMSDTKGCHGTGCCSKTASLEPGLTDLRAKLCYGCQLTLKDTKGDLMTLPFVADNLKRSKKREEMREEIQDFLLQDVAHDV